MSYHTCEYCGANLDPGEKCDCKEEDLKLEEWIILRKMVKPPSDEGKVVKVDKETYERIVDISAATSIPIQRLVTRFINAALEHTKIIEED